MQQRCQKWPGLDKEVLLRGVVGLLWTPSWTTGGQRAVSLLVTTSLAFPKSSSVLKEAVPLISCRPASCHLAGASRLGQCIALYIPGR